MVNEGCEKFHRPDLKLQTRGGGGTKQRVRVTDVFIVASKEVSSRIESTVHA